HDSQIVGNNFHDIGRECSVSTKGMEAIFINEATNHNTDNITIEGNLFHDIGRYGGISSEPACSPTSAYYQHNDHAIYVHGSTNLTIKNNIFYNIKHGWSVQAYPNASTNLNILNNT